MELINLSVEVLRENIRFSLIMEILGDENFKPSKESEAFLREKANEANKKAAKYEKRLKDKL